MKLLRLKDLIDLAASDTHAGATHIQKLYEWRFEQSMSVVRWILGISASLAVAILAAALLPTKDGYLLHSSWRFAIAILLPVLSGSYGIYRMRELSRMNSEFIAALKLYSNFYEVRTFIRLYRGSR